MGSGIIEAGAGGCDGQDVLHDLDDVFGHPNSQKYQAAKTASLTLFQGVPNGTNNYVKLYQAYQAAYQAAGVTPCQNWEPYLATLSPDNIFLIAHSRSMGLSLNWAMTTKTHDPQNGGNGVNVSSGVGSVTIDSPYSADISYRKRRKP